IDPTELKARKHITDAEAFFIFCTRELLYYGAAYDEVKEKAKLPDRIKAIFGYPPPPPPLSLSLS
ncbi:hypothetical protein KIPB_012957, partial [Kipferlia bialata]